MGNQFPWRNLLMELDISLFSMEKELSTRLLLLKIVGLDFVCKEKLSLTSIYFAVGCLPVRDSKAVRCRLSKVGGKARKPTSAIVGGTERMPTKARPGCRGRGLEEALEVRIRMLLLPRGQSPPSSAFRATGNSACSPGRTLSGWERPAGLGRWWPKSRIGYGFALLFALGPASCHLSGEPPHTLPLAS